MAQRLAAEESAMYAAVGCHSYFLLLPNVLDSFRSTPVMEVHGQSDPVVPYENPHESWTTGAFASRDSGIGRTAQKFIHCIKKRGTAGWVGKETRGKKIASGVDTAALKKLLTEFLPACGTIDISDGYG